MKSNVSFKLAANEWVIKARWFYVVAIALMSVALRWKEIWELNTDQIPNPDMIVPGIILKLPRR